MKKIISTTVAKIISSSLGLVLFGVANCSSSFLINQPKEPAGLSSFKLIK